MEKILITGGAGYLGAEITTHFIELGYNVTVLDSLLYNKNTLDHLKKKNNFKFIEGDVRDNALYLKEISNNDIIFPLAGIVGAPLCEKFENEAYEVNELSIKNLSDNVSKDQIIIFPTTNSGYGTTAKNIICTEEMDLKPISHYGITKVNAEKCLSSKQNFISLRLATVFGASYRNRLDLLVNFFVYNAVKNKKIVLFEPHFRRNYIHVRDIAYTFEHCLKNFNNMRNNVYNVGLSQANLTKLELCKLIKKQLDEFEIIISKDGKDPDQRDYYVSNEKIEKTNWEAKVNIDEGISELINHFKNFKETKYDRNY